MGSDLGLPNELTRNVKLDLGSGYLVLVDSIVTPFQLATSGAQRVAWSRTREFTFEKHRHQDDAVKSALAPRPSTAQRSSLP